MEKKRKEENIVNMFRCYKLLFKGTIVVVQFYRHSLCTTHIEMVCHFNTAKCAAVHIKKEKEKSKAILFMKQLA